MEHALRPTSIPVWRQLEDRACPRSTSELGRSVEVSSRVQYQTSYRVPPVIAVLVERIENILRPTPISVWRQLEDGSPRIDATLVGRTVEISCMVEDRSP